jgi:hypothetical protein
MSTNEIVEAVLERALANAKSLKNVDDLRPHAHEGVAIYNEAFAEGRTQITGQRLGQIALNRWAIDLVNS